MNNGPSLPATMAWQIFRKDFRLLWPLALAGAGGQALVALLNHRPPPYAESYGFSALAALPALGVAVAISLLIVLAVQQEAIPGVNQDWLVRPIRRRDLLLAKLLVVALLVHAPMAAINVLRGLSYGLPLDQCLGAALLSTFDLALVFSLPLMAIAALTRSVTEPSSGRSPCFSVSCSRACWFLRCCLPSPTPSIFPIPRAEPAWPGYGNS